MQKISVPCAWHAVTAVVCAALDAVADVGGVVIAGVVVAAPLVGGKVAYVPRGLSMPSGP